MISKTINVKLIFREDESLPNYKLRPEQFMNIDEYTHWGYTLLIINTQLSSEKNVINHS